MARRPPKLTVVITATAQRELLRIWDYNADDRSVRRADAWDAFVRAKIHGLATAYHQSRLVENFPDLRHVTAKKSPSAHGHVIVFEVNEVAKVVNILHVFHTRQDVQARLQKDQ